MRAIGQKLTNVCSQTGSKRRDRGDRREEEAIAHLRDLRDLRVKNPLVDELDLDLMRDDTGFVAFVEKAADAFLSAFAVV